MTTPSRPEEDLPGASDLVRAILDNHAQPWAAAGTETQRAAILAVATDQFDRKLAQILTGSWSV